MSYTPIFPGGSPVPPPPIDTPGAGIPIPVEWNKMGGDLPLRVTPNGPADGGNYGLKTPNTTTAGINEAIASLPIGVLGSNPTVGGGEVILSRGIYVVSGQIQIPVSGPFQLKLRGAGKLNTVIYYTGTSDLFVMTGTPPTGGTGNLVNLEVSGLTIVYANGTAQAAIMNLSNIASLDIHDNVFVGGTAITGSGTSNLGGYSGDFHSPQAPQGVVGIILNQIYNNRLQIHNNFFGNMAIGIDLTGDHATITDNEFNFIGAYVSSGTLTYGNVYTTLPYSMNAAIVFRRGLEPLFQNNHYFSDGMCVFDYLPTGLADENEELPIVLGGYMEDCQYGIVSYNSNKDLVGWLKSNNGYMLGAMGGGTTINTTPDVVANFRLINVQDFSSTISSIHAPQAASVGASPATITNTGIGRQRFYVSGGAVTSIAVNGIVVGLTSGMFLLDPNDSLVITYTTAPSVYYQ